MKITFIHQVAANLFAYAIGKEDVIGHDDGGTGRPFAVKGVVNDLQEIELFIG